MADEPVIEAPAAAAAAPETSLTAAPEAGAEGAGAEGGTGGQQSSEDGQGGSESAGQGTGPEGAPAEGADGQGAPAGTVEGAEAQGATEFTAFTMPDEFRLSDDLLGRVTEFAKTHKLDQTAAQAIVDLGVQQQQAMVAEFAKEALAAPVPLSDHWAQQWSQQTAKDAEIGGPKLQETMGLASRVCSTFATPALVDFLNVTGLCHHPELVRFMHKVGQAISEDTLVVPSGGQQRRQATDAASVLYPNMARAPH